MLIIHSLYILFVLLGLVLVLIGAFAQWQWVRNFYFRIIHIAAIVIVVLQSWLGIMCPLTVWEAYCRNKAGLDPLYADSFIRYWLHKLIFFNAEPWLFTLMYTMFALLVLMSWIMIPPKRLSV